MASEIITCWFKLGLEACRGGSGRSGRVPERSEQAVGESETFKNHSKFNERLQKVRFCFLNHHLLVLGRPGGLPRRFGEGAGEVRRGPGRPSESRNA